MIMSNNSIVVGSLVLFKNKPALVQAVSDKFTISIDGGGVKKVRAKDIELIHPGPASSLGALELTGGNIQDAWEMIQGEEVSLEDLSELIYDTYSPASAWSTWLLISDGLYFSGSISTVYAKFQEDIDAVIKAKSDKEAGERLWNESIARIKSGQIIETDENNLKEVEKLAYGQSQASKVMRELNMDQSIEKAHNLLLRLGRWSEHTNPYPIRQGCPIESADGHVPELEEEVRTDLTHLQSYAIDDEGNKDPDDAISIEGDTLWIHIADVAALIKTGSELDHIAQSRGANLYIPEGCVHMLPQAVTTQLGLGLSEISPALSFGVTFNDDMSIKDVQLKPSLVKVTRMTYQETNEMLDQEPFAEIVTLTQAFEKRRLANGAASVDMPEVTIKVDDGKVTIRTLPRYDSREMVTNAMLIAGEAVALFCQENEISIPYVTQAPPEEFEVGDGLATHFANIRKFRRSEVKVGPDYHAGLGMDAYTRATSPLRRYTDLLVHQQIRTFIAGGTILTEDKVLEKISESQCAANAVRMAERESNKHWSLVYLMQNKEWTGTGVLVDKRDNRGTWIIPELNIQTKLSFKSDLSLNAEVQLSINNVDLPELISRFRIV